MIAHRSLLDFKAFDVAGRLPTAKAARTVLILSGIGDALGGEAELKVVDGFMCDVCKKLFEACGGRDYIETTWGRGYTLREPDEGGPPLTVADM